MFDLFEFPLVKDDCIIEANAGTGKSYTLKWLVIRLIIEKKIPANKIVILSFTRKTAHEMQVQIDNLIYEIQQVYSGNPCNLNDLEILYLNRFINNQSTIRLIKEIKYFPGFIGTIHSLALNLLNDQFLLGYNLYSESIDSSNKELLDQALENIYSKYNKKIYYNYFPNNTDVIRNTIYKISTYSCFKVIPSIKELLSMFNDYRTSEDEKIKSFNSLLCHEVWLKYRELKIDTFNIDYSDILTQVLTLVNVNNDKENDFINRFSFLYECLLVDEFQDTDKIQVELFNKLFKKKSTYRIFVGDPKQSIYSFRGADINVYLKFKHSIEDSSKINYLIENYRSSLEYTNAINTLINNNDNPFDIEDIKYKSSKIGAHSKIKPNLHKNLKPINWVMVLADNNVNVKFLKNDFRKKINDRLINDILSVINKDNTVSDKINLNNIAILVRKNSQKIEIVKKLALNNIPYDLNENLISVYNEEIDQDLILFIKVLLNKEPKNNSNLMKLFTSSLVNLTIKESWKIINDQKKIFYNFKNELKTCSDILVHENITSTLNYFFELCNEIFNKHDVFERRSTLFSNKNNNSQLNLSIEFINWLLLNEENIDFDNIDIYKNNWLNNYQKNNSSSTYGIKILTIHKAKGLEFDTVFLPDIWDIGVETVRSTKIIGEIEKDNRDFYQYNLLLEKNFSIIDEQIAEERRVIYTAITRAKYNSFIYCIKEKKAVEKGIIWKFFNFTPNKWEDVVNLLVNFTNKHLNYFSFSIFDEVFNEMPSEKKHNAPYLNSKNTQTNYSIINFQQNETPVFEFKNNVKSKVLIESHSSITRKLTNNYYIKSDNLDDELYFEETTKIIENDEKTNLQIPSNTYLGSFFHELLENWDFKGTNTSNFIDEIDLKQRILNNFISTIQDNSLLNSYYSFCYNILKILLRLKLPAANKEKICLPEYNKMYTEWEFILTYDKYLSNIKQANNALVANLIKNQPDNIITNESYYDKTRKIDYLTGKIDFIGKYGEKYYIIDWKTNNLENYKDLTPAIIKNSYTSQSLIYTLALKNYLTAFKKDCDFDQIFGGCYFIFLRGISMDEDNSEKSKGIFFLSPEILKSSLLV